MTKLHYALDVLTVEVATKLAAASAASGISTIEAGSLLIKIAGLGILTQLREVAPNSTIVADLKTLDMGYQEIEAAADVGADEIIIAAVASDATIAAAVEAAHARDVQVLATLIGVLNWRHRASEVRALGVDLVLAHNAIDDPHTWLDPGRRTSLDELAQECAPDFGVSGCLDLDVLPQILSLAPERLIVGRAITCAPNLPATLDRWLAAVEGGTYPRA